MQSGAGHFLLERQPAFASQPHVENEATRHVRFLERKELAYGSERLDGKSHRAQQIAEGETHRFLIVYDVDDGCFTTCHGCGRALSGNHAGSSLTRVVRDARRRAGRTIIGPLWHSRRGDAARSRRRASTTPSESVAPAVILVYDPLKRVWVRGVFLHVCRAACAGVFLMYSAMALRCRSQPDLPIHPCAAGVIPSTFFR